MAAPTPFLRGSFEAYSLAELFAVLALSRQYYDLRFSDNDGEVGALALKAGQVIGAEDFRTRTEGVDALNALIGDPGTAFSLVMLPPNAPEARNGAPLCGLAELLPEEDGGNHAAAEPPSGEVIGTDEIFEISGPQFPAGSPQHDAVEVPPASPPGPEAAHPAGDAELRPLGAEPPDAATEAAPPETPTPELSPAADAVEVAPALPPGPEAAHPAGDAELQPLGAEPPDAATEAAPPETPTPEDGVPIMQGRMDDASFDEILEVLQLSDRCIVVSFLRGDAEVGAMMVESGQVVAAAAGGLHGMEALRQLCADHGETFEIHNGTAEDAGEPLGGVPELLAAMRQPAPAPAAPDAGKSRGALFLRGRLADFPLDLLIGALDLSRQPIDIEFRRGEAILHRVHVKAGTIVGAESVAGDGAAHALAAIRNDPGEEFRVYRRRSPLDGEPVATLAALVPEPEVPGEPQPETPAPEVDPSAESAAGLEAFRDRAAAEIQATPADSGRGRREHVLLWSILGLQIACLALVLGAIVLARL